jgi:parallel beta-helix repeat protein
MSKKSKFFQFIIISTTLFSAFFVFLSCQIALAEDFYVSPTGTAIWPNCTSETNPCQASNSVKTFLGASAGDTVYFLDGVYSGLASNSADEIAPPNWNPKNSGTSGNPIIFRSLNLHGAHLIGLSSSHTTTVIGAYSKNYINWDGFRVSAVNSSAQAIKPRVGLRYSTGSKILNCEIIGATHNAGGSSPNNEGIRLDNSSYALVENNLVRDFRETSNNHNNSAIKFFGTTHSTVKNNEFRNSSVGIYLKTEGNNNITMENNYVHSNYTNIHHEQRGAPMNSLTFRNNVVAGASYATVTMSSNRGVNDTSDDMLIYKNTFRGPGGWRWTKANAGKGPKIYNNIFVTSGSGQYGYQYSLWSEYEGTPPVECDHNRVESTVAKMREYGSNTKTYSSLSSWQLSGELFGGGNPDNGSIASNPHFVNSSGSYSELSDFELTSNSPCKGTGRSGADMGADISLVGVKVEQNFFCGDGICNGAEICSSCPADCGSCSSLPGDINKDGLVNIFDYNIFLQHFGATNDCQNVADLNGDCSVNIFDYNILLQNFGRTS